MSECGKAEEPFGEGLEDLFRPRGAPSPFLLQVQGGAVSLRAVSCGPGSRVSSKERLTPSSQGICASHAGGLRLGSEGLTVLPWAGGGVPTPAPCRLTCGCACLCVCACVYMCVCVHVCVLCPLQPNSRTGRLPWRCNPSRVPRGETLTTRRRPTCTRRRSRCCRASSPS